MNTRVRKVVTAINRDGVAFSEVHTETLHGESWRPNDPVTLDNTGPEAKEWQERYNAAALAQAASLRIENEQLRSQLETAQGELGKATSGIETLQADLQETGAALNARNDLFAALLAERNAIAAAHNQLAAELAEAKNARDLAVSQRANLEAQVTTLQRIKDLETVVESLSANKGE